MNISNVAELSGVPPKTIRYYEQIGLVRPRRAANNYRAFTELDIHKLVFLARARSLGFSIEDCRALIALHEDHHRASAGVKALAEAQLARIDRQLGELQSMRARLEQLVTCCPGDGRSDCPILDDLAGRHSQGQSR